MSDPFKIDGPALISFSGGRTSGMMLYKIIEAHGGKLLPDDVIPCFANTGKEHEATYRFIAAFARKYDVDIKWLQANRSIPCKFEERDFISASRNGEPFAELIKRKSYLPNPIARFCTTDLKIKVMENFATSLGWKDWQVALGLRADEPRRLVKVRARAGNLCPLADAGITKADVLAFWKAQPFDLALPADGSLSNCDLCYLKGADKLISIIRQEPARADWWIAQEAGGKMFRNDRPNYAALKYMATQPQLAGMESEDSLPCECHD